MHAARSSDHEPAARTIGVGDLATQADEIVREVNETGRPVDIVRNGQVAARLSPVSPIPPPTDIASSTAEEQERAIRDWLRKMDDASRQIAAVWPEGVSAQDVIDDVRGSW
jgi:antitoxin (DNA-binding transcriptional repressor) of toxin-antitoxin stability system